MPGRSIAFIANAARSCDSGTVAYNKTNTSLSTRSFRSRNLESLLLRSITLLQRRIQIFNLNLFSSRKICSLLLFSISSRQVSTFLSRILWNQLAKGWLERTRSSLTGRPLWLDEFEVPRSRRCVIGGQWSIPNDYNAPRMSLPVLNTLSMYSISPSLRP